jgi:hypothetical protein
VHSAFLAAVIAAGLILIYLSNGRTTGSSDTFAARYLPLTILREGTFYLDSMPFLYTRGSSYFIPAHVHAHADVPYYLRRVNGHYVSEYPPWAAVFALPIYLPPVLRGIAADGPDVARVEKLAAATIVALSAAVLYLALRRLTTTMMALTIIAAYGLGSSTLSLTSQALWQHGPSQLCLAAALYGLVAARSAAPPSRAGGSSRSWPLSRSAWLLLAGFAAGWAAVVRPANILMVVAFGAYVTVHHRRHAIHFGAAAVPAFVCQVLYNAAYFGHPFRLQFPVLDAGLWTTPFWDGLSGVLGSPGRGLFIYSPVFLFSLVGFALAWRLGGDPLLRYASVGFALTVLTYAKWFAWWGGHVYGPRFLSDITPVLSLALYPLRDVLASRWAIRVAFVVALAWSVAAHSIGAFVDDQESSMACATQGRFPDILWSWRSNQLVNPVRVALDGMILRARSVPTSTSAPARLAASYTGNLSVPAGASSPSRTTLSPATHVPLSVRARNEGEAVWLASAPGDRGSVRLVWRWFLPEGSELPIRGRAALCGNVRSGADHTFAFYMTTPHEAGNYLLEVGLLSEGVAWFSELGTPPLRFGVSVIE